MMLSEDVLTTFGIELVIRGTVHESEDASSEEARYKVAKERGILRWVWKELYCIVYFFCFFSPASQGSL